jgi:(p)ppGpp synthase/HD superfamily hydrolase
MTDVAEEKVALIRRAKVRAKRAHEGQTRRGNGEPYIGHPTRVALAVAEYVSPEAVAAAYLHDVVEDTDMKIDDFPPYVQELVDHLTRRKGEDKDASIKRLSDAQCPEAVIIKIADRTDNLVDGKQLGKNWTKGYLKGAQKILAAAKANGLDKHPLTVNLKGAVMGLRRWAYSKDD